MTTIESNKKTIAARYEDIYQFLGDMNHFGELMPEQIENWKSDTDSCSFRISGMADIALKIVERVPFGKIVVSSDGKTPVSFTMVMHITATSETTSDFQIVFLSDMNSFMAMMVTKPLTNFVNTLARKLSEYYA